MWKNNPMKDEMGYITQVQLDKLFESARSNLRNYMLISTLAYTGRRISEIVRGTNGYGIRPKDIDFEMNNITYRILKKNKRTKAAIDFGLQKEEPITKSLPVNPQFLMVLKKFIEAENIQPEAFLFDITRQRAGQIIRKIGNDAGITMIGSKKLHPHHFRHTFAVNITRVSMATPEDIKELQNLLQHSSIDMTMEYLRYGHTRGRELVNELSFGQSKV